MTDLHTERAERATRVRAELIASGAPGTPGVVLSRIRTRVTWPQDHAGLASAAAVAWAGRTESEQVT
ncbi:MAG TPA: hypothetical protein PKA88_06270 [Polyangiaceae bacterium]|nr:hypothetical protein [Polyangiaceae bacterium]